MVGSGSRSLIKKSIPEAISEVGLRLTAILLFFLVFFPAMNPARLSGKINRNISLFTSGFFYNELTNNLERIISKGWIPQNTMIFVFLSALLLCLGIFSASAGACMSLGNRPLKKYGGLFGLAGSLAILMGVTGMGYAKNLMWASPNTDKITPLEPMSLKFFLVLGLLLFVFSALCLVFLPKKMADEKANMAPPMRLFLMMLPFLILVFLFSYLPLWGWRYSFFNYQPGETLTLQKFTGFFWFKFLFQNAATVKDLLRVVQNTLAMSGLGILTSWLPIGFAVFLTEIKTSWFKRIVQTLTTIPNFISWVLVYAVAFCIFSTDGFLSSLFINAGIWDKGVNMLMGGENTWLRMLAWGTWKGLGWGAIIYLAAISAIDPQLYEAATVDGAGRFQKIWHITLPALIPTFMVMLLLSIAGILNNGMEQYLVFENSSNTGPITVLDLYVYKLGIGQGVIPLSTVVGMMKSIISVALLFVANAISKVVRGTSIV